jgi:hypothetical protein
MVDWKNFTRQNEEDVEQALQVAKKHQVREIKAKHVVALVKKKIRNNKSVGILKAMMGN